MSCIVRCIVLQELSAHTNGNSSTSTLCGDHFRKAPIWQVLPSLAHAICLMGLCTAQTIVLQVQAVLTV